MISLEVATPGTNGIEALRAVFISFGVPPGESAYLAPASMAALRSFSLNTVPAPTIISGASLATALMALSAAGVRRVISIVRTPLASSTRASGTASAASSMVTTGMTGESVSTAVASWGLLMISISACLLERRKAKLRACGSGV